MKFAIINDMHVGPPESGYAKGIQRKLVTKAEPLVEEFVKKMNNEEHPEFVVNLGDSIEDVNNREVDIASFKRAISLLAPLDMPIHYLIGNHDIRTLTQEEIADILGYDQMYYSFDHDSYHFVVLSFEMIGDHTNKLGDIGAVVPQKQLEWLKNDLSQSQKPVVVFVHYGLADDDMQGNFWFEKAPQYGLMKNRAEVRRVLEDSGKVRAVLSAHQHWNRMLVHSDIPYITVTSLVENFNNDGIPAEAYTIVGIDEKKITVDVKGNDPARFEHRF
jgi:alkaline phosphatase